jgi:hypothetical protein
MCGLALMSPKRGQLAVEHIGDVHKVVRTRAAHQPHFADLPRLQPLLVQQLRMRERVPCIGKVRAQGCLAGGSMIRMVPMEATPAPLGTPGEHPGGLHLADQPRDVPAERIGRLDAAVWVAKKPHVRHAEHSGRGLLLGLADSWDGRSGDLGIEPTGIAIAQHTVGHSSSSIGPGGDRPTRPEIDIVRVSNDNQRISNVAVSKNHDHSSQLTRWQQTRLRGSNATVGPPGGADGPSRGFALGANTQPEQMPRLRRRRPRCFLAEDGHACIGAAES